MPLQSPHRRLGDCCKGAYLFLRLFLPALLTFKAAARRLASWIVKMRHLALANKSAGRDKRSRHTEAPIHVTAVHSEDKLATFGVSPFNISVTLEHLFLFAVLFYKITTVFYRAKRSSILGIPTLVGSNPHGRSISWWAETVIPEAKQLMK